MPLQVYSTLTRTKEPFHKEPGAAVSMYVCGPTVYKPSHIGHMVGPVIFDTVKRYLTYYGYQVTWVVNVTDVDDKLINRAKELGTTVPALAKQMTDDYFECLKALNVTGVDHFPKATEHVGGMIQMIARLVEKGAAYPAGGDVYFDITKADRYGKLCGFNPDELESGARIEVSDRKRNPGDFALWKGAKPGEPAEVQFDSPWGKGRPGWHIECSAMATKLLGDTLDIHGGGLDLRFPHHEDELAQSESATGKEFARIWMHNGLLRMGNEKMAGSVGNVVNVADAVKHMSGDAIRYFILKTHYRSPIDMGEWPKDDTGKPIRPLPDGMLEAKAAHDTFVRFAERFERVTGTAFRDLEPPGQLDARSTATIPFAHFHRRFLEFMDDDFNTGGAVGVLHDLVGGLNKIADAGKLEDPKAADKQNKADFAEGAVLVREMTQILGLTLDPPKAVLGGGDELVAGLMQLLLDLRDNLRTQAKLAGKDNPLKQYLFGQADQIRIRLGQLGVIMEDGPAGTRWRVG